MDLNSLGKRLIEARKKKFLTQLQAADLVGINERSLQGHELNEHRPGNNTIVRYVRIYECNKEYLLTGKGKFSLNNNKKDGEIRGDKRVGEGFRSVRSITGEYSVSPYGEASDGLRDIFNSGEQVLISAIQANIRAFQVAAHREHQNAQQSQKIKDLEEKCDEFKKRLEYLERKLEDNPPHDHKEEPTKQKVM